MPALVSECVHWVLCILVWFSSTSFNAAVQPNFSINLLSKQATSKLWAAPTVQRQRSRVEPPRKGLKPRSQHGTLSIYSYTHACIYVYMFICIHIYICMHIERYIYIYICVDG